ncbi:NUDIX hydrolase [Thiospirochaeta perfilievii]|uniref:GDP-mannose pyrophosphatase n=1 Tax=Thiospirochaeta perfilievii TaxID=252967 RepID=A0A5C1QHI4_9SPIO|nr:NUDIX hydrolase [Thiospirochaeta perfilievii]QEN05712.1 NUDIX hydrolase [Thiospirochaeta perfilievii]
MVKKWITKSKEFLNDYRIFKTYRVKRESSDSGISGDFFLVDPPNWVMVIPVLNNSNGEECFLMVKQYRHGSNSVTLEFPAGMVDNSEVAIETGLRELAEETGYNTTNIKEIGNVNPNPAFMTNKITTLLARDLKRVWDQDLDEHEEIDTLLVPIKEFDKMIGEFTTSNSVVNSAITLQAYLLYLKSL